MKKLLIVAALMAFFSASHATWECEWDAAPDIDLYSPGALNEALQQETSPLKIAGMAVIRLYQMNLSGKTGSDCNFYPSCSRYSYFAIKKYGLLKGAVMAADRVQRCHNCSFMANYPPDYAHGLLSDPPEKNDTFNFIFDWLNF